MSTIVQDIERGVYIKSSGTEIPPSDRPLSPAEEIYKQWVRQGPEAPLLNIIINTCAGTQNEKILDKAGSYGTGATYGSRRHNLRKMLASYEHPALRVIVVGEWYPGRGYLYIEDPGKTKSPEDQAQQRSTGEEYCEPYAPILYLNDDHYLPQACILPCLKELEEFKGVLAFPRATPEGKRLVDGWPEYVHGHASMAHPVAMDEGLHWGLVKPTPGGVGWTAPYGWQADLQYTYHMRRLFVKAKMSSHAVTNLENRKPAEWTL